MPIQGSSPRECFEEFRRHVASIVAATLSEQEPITVASMGDRATLEFHRGALSLSTRYGNLYLVLGQALYARNVGRHSFRLETEKYWYRIQETEEGDAIIRWEYERNAAPHCRHHVHVSVDIPIGSAALDLRRAHTPTGWVTIEEVIRFLIVELGVTPPCGGSWDQRLQDAERRFYEDFTSKRYKP